MSKVKDKALKSQYYSIFLCWLTYTCVYFGRYSYSSNITLVKDYYNVSNGEAGLVMTFFSIAYGCGQLINGLFCKKYPKKYAIPVALSVTAIANLLVFLGIQFSAIKYLWFISALFQSMMWPLTLQVISENVSNKLINKAILTLSTATSCGTLLVYGTSALFSKLTFILSFLFGSLVLFSIAILWFLTYKKGNYAEERIEDIDEVPEKNGKKKMTVYVLIPLILLSLLSIITNFEKDGLQTWVPAILKQTHSLPDSISIVLTLILPLFGIFGSIFAVNLSKKISKVMTMIIFFYSFIALFIGMVLLFQSSLATMVATFGILELLLHGVSNVLTNIFPLQMRKSMDPGMLAGVLNGSAYFGSATSAYLLGKIADISGWNMVFITLLGIIVAGIVFVICYSIIAAKNKNFTIK